MNNKTIIKISLSSLVVSFIAITFLKIALTALSWTYPDLTAFKFPLIVPSVMKIMFDITSLALVILSCIYIGKGNYPKKKEYLITTIVLFSVYIFLGLLQHHVALADHFQIVPAVGLLLSTSIFYPMFVKK